MKNAKLVVGADGRHSVVRKSYMEKGNEEKLTDIENLNYFIEIKFEAPQVTKKRTNKELMLVQKCEGVAFETLSSKKETRKGAFKPVTNHFFVGKTTYDAFNDATDANPWDLKRLQQEAAKDPIIASQTAKIIHYLQGIIDRGGSCKDVKIKRLPIEIYRSEEVVVVQDERVITLLGDAAAGAVFARGVNKAFREAAALAQAVKQFFSGKTEIHNQIPKEFEEYQDKMKKIFVEERFWARRKASWLGKIRTTLRYIVTPTRWLITVPFSFVKNYFFKTPTLNDLMKVMEERNRIVQADYDNSPDRELVPSDDEDDFNLHGRIF